MPLTELVLALAEAGRFWIDSKNVCQIDLNSNSVIESARRRVSEQRDFALPQDHAFASSPLCGLIC